MTTLRIKIPYITHDLALCRISFNYPGTFISNVVKVCCYLLNYLFYSTSAGIYLYAMK